MIESGTRVRFQNHNAYRLGTVEDHVGNWVHVRDDETGMLVERWDTSLLPVPVENDEVQHLSKHEERHLGGDRSTLCGIPFANLGFNFTVYDERDGFSFNEGAPRVCESCRLAAAKRPWGGR